MKKETQKNNIFFIQGGIGKNIMATAVVASLKTARPDELITIATPYTFIWNNNPHIAGTIDLASDTTAYTKLLKHGDWDMLNKDPYHAEDYLYRRKHLNEVWASLIGVPLTVREPHLYTLDTPSTTTKTLLVQSNKPYFFIQTNGGAPVQPTPISWARDLPLTIAQEIVDAMNARGYTTVHIRRADQPILKDVLWLDGSPEDIMRTLPLSSKRLFIDSFPQHAAAALSLPSVVTWVTNDPKVFGYNIHSNIQTKAIPEYRHHPESYLERYDITGAIQQCPYDVETLFSVEEILKALEK